MSIEIGAKVKIKADTEPAYFAGKTATVIEGQYGSGEWDCVIELDDYNGEGELGYNTNELEVIQ